MKITIVIPVYNGEKYVNRAIDSALRQTYSNTEILVINDGSTDDTGRLVKAYGNKITLYDKYNGGTSDAWNYALPLINTKYVAGLDADDEFYPETIEKLVSMAIKNPELDLIYSDYVFIDSDGNKYKEVQNPECKTPEEAIRKLFKLYERLGEADNFLPFGHVRFYKTSALRNIGGYDAKFLYAEDFDLVLRLAEAGCIFKRIGQFLYKYRWHGKNKGITHRYQQKEDVKKSLKMYCQRNNKDLYDNS